MNQQPNERLSALKKNMRVGLAMALGLALAFGIPKIMNANNRAVNDFVKSYNALEVNMERFIKFMETEARPNEKVPEGYLTGVLLNLDALANKEKKGCDAIPDKTIKSECKTAFGQYYALFKSIEADGLTEANLVKAHELGPVIDDVVEKIINKYRLKTTEK